jgi:hypothetical protein
MIIAEDIHHKKDFPVPAFVRKVVSDNEAKSNDGDKIF